MRRPHVVVSALLFVSIMSGYSISVAMAQTCQAKWLPGHGPAGVDGVVFAATSWDPDGNGPRGEVFVAGGMFRNAGGVPANNIAFWDPESVKGVRSVKRIIKGLRMILKVLHPDTFCVPALEGHLSEKRWAKRRKSLPDRPRKAANYGRSARIEASVCV
jgi:hypothetical protein